MLLKVSEVFKFPEGATDSLKISLIRAWLGSKKHAYQTYNSDYIIAFSLNKYQKSTAPPEKLFIILSDDSRIN